MNGMTLELFTKFDDFDDFDDFDEFEEEEEDFGHEPGLPYTEDEIKEYCREQATQSLWDDNVVVDDDDDYLDFGGFSEQQVNYIIQIILSGGEIARECIPRFIDSLTAASRSRLFNHDDVVAALRVLNQ